MKRSGIEARRKRGFSLIEVMVALVVMLIAVGAFMSVFTLAIGQNANQGENATRTTEYAQDKMEQLMALSFSDAATNTTVYPPAASGGTGLGGTMAASASVGGITPGSPVTGYVDYLSSTGSLLTSATGSLYSRQWTITTNAAATLKTITVYVRATKSVARGSAPSTTLVCLKTNVQ